jgi:hypothetical protein
MDCDGLDCDQQTVAHPFGIYVPSRGSANTVHADALDKVIVAFTLPADELMQNLLITLTGKANSGAIRIAAQIKCMAILRTADTPDYTLGMGDKTIMNAEDTDISVNVAANGDAGINITAKDFSSDIGTINWNYQIWVLDELLLS